MKKRDREELATLAIAQGWNEDRIIEYFIFGYEIVAHHDGIVLGPHPKWERLAQDAFIKGAELAEGDYDDATLNQDIEKIVESFAG